MSDQRAPAVPGGDEGEPDEGYRRRWAVWSVHVWADRVRTGDSPPDGVMSLGDVLTTLLELPASLRFRALHRLVAAGHVDPQALDVGLVDGYSIGYVAPERLQVGQEPVLITRPRDLLVLRPLPALPCVVLPGAVRNQACDVCVHDGITTVTATGEMYRDFSAMAKIVDPRSWQHCNSTVWSKSDPCDANGDPAVVADPVGSSWQGYLREHVAVVGLSPYQLVLAVSFWVAQRRVRVDFELHKQLAPNPGYGELLLTLDDGYLEAEDVGGGWVRTSVVKRLNFGNVEQYNELDEMLPDYMCEWMDVQTSHWAACTVP